jgi:hypothetical protein
MNHETFQGRADSYLLSSIDENGKTQHQWLPSETYIKGFNQPMKTTNLLYKTSYDIKFMQPFSDTIFSVNNDTVKPYLAFSTKNRITPADIDEMNKIKDPVLLAKQYWKCKKFLGVRDYVENQFLTMFMFQNQGSTHTLFYYPDKSSLFCTRYRVVDDLTQVSGYRRFFSGYKNYFVSAFDNSGKNLDQLIEKIQNGNLAIESNDNCKFEDLTSASNPVVVFYECRKELKQQLIN